MSELVVQQQKKTNSEDENQFLTFQVDEESLAVGILDVKEIIEIGEMTRVPMTPDYIRGVINLRGNVVPVIDLSARLGRKVSEITKRSSIILVDIHSGDEEQTLGMLVDEVNEIIEIGVENIQPAPNFGTDIRTEFIQAMGRIEEQFIILLSIPNVLSVEELAMLGKMTQPGQGSTENTAIVSAE